jgi:hypothetical protein
MSFFRHSRPSRHFNGADIMRFDMRREGTSRSLIRKARPRHPLAVLM